MNELDFPLPAWFATDWSVLTVAGPDAAKFLHNLTTNDVNRLQPGGACETLFTDVKGKVIAHAVLGRTSGAIEVVVTSPRAPELAEHLDRYHIREEMTIEAGKSRGVLVTLGDATKPPPGGALPLPVLGPGAGLLLGDLEQLAAAAEGDPLDATRFDALRVRHRFPLDSVDVDSRNLPQELSRDGDLISFTKGCYLGQETVARIDALGRVNRRLVRLRWPKGSGPEGSWPEGSGPVSPGDELRAGEKVVGRVTTAAPAADALIALAYIRREHAGEGSELESPAGPAHVW